MIDRQLPDSIAIFCPDTWAELPLEASEFEAFRAETLATAKLAGALSATDRRRLELAMTQLQNYLLEERCVFAASLVAANDSTEVDQDNLLMASVAITLATRKEIDTAVPLNAAILLQAMTDHRIDRDSSAFDEIEAPTITSVGDLQCVKLMRLHRNEGRDVDSSVYQQTYLVPAAEGDALVSLHFMTPSVGHARELSELFDAMAQTMRLLYPSEPTLEPERNLTVD